MTADTIGPAETGTEETEAAEAGGGNKLGRVLDIAGIAAGVILGVILFDIFSGGKLTRWARDRRGPGKPDSGCEGCGGEGAPDDD